MYDVIIEHDIGGIVLSGNEKDWSILSITGLEPVASQLQMSDVVGMDGQRYQGSRLTTRNIVIMLRINSNVEQNRLYLYEYLPQDRPIRFYYTTSSRSVVIEGYVERIDCDFYQRDTIMQISIICPDPFFRDTTVDHVKLGSYTEFLEFPIEFAPTIAIEDHITSTEVTIDNPSQIEIPFEIEVTARKQLIYFTSFTIQNTLTGEQIGFAGWPNDDGFMPGDVIYINTDSAHPTMRLTIGSTQTTYNRIGQMIRGGTFFTIHPGKNFITYKTNPASDAGFLTIDLKYQQLYRGV